MPIQEIGVAGRRDILQLDFTYVLSRTQNGSLCEQIANPWDVVYVFCDVDRSSELCV